MLVTAACPDLPIGGQLPEDVAAYLSAVARKINEQLTLYRGIPKPGVALQFSVSADGSVQDINVIRPSGNPDIDLALQRAISGAGPFGEPPKWRTPFAVEVTFESDDAHEGVTRGGESTNRVVRIWRAAA